MPQDGKENLRLFAESSGKNGSSPEGRREARARKNRAEDYDLVARAKTNEQSAFARIMEKYRMPLRYHISKIVHNQEILDDLVQEIFLKAFDNIHTFDTSYAFSTWIYRIATNHSIDYLRKKKLRTLSIDQPVRGKDGDMQIELPDRSPDNETDQELIDKQRRQIIHDAIESLPEKYARIIKMRHIDDQSYQEIADELQLPLGTVKAHIFRARELLNKYLIDRRGSF
jgi:RNA polymerase sigma-70 factor (ECF subfamily)